MKILCPTDFSENATKACEYTVQLFGNVQCEIILLHAYSKDNYTKDYQKRDKGFLRDFYKKVELNTVQKLKELKTHLEEKYHNTNHQFVLHAAHNSLVDEVKICLQKFKPDLIAMGTQGATGLSKVFFGSNTLHVLKRATCPILAIPKKFQFSPVKEILFPTNFQVQFSEDLLSLLITISIAFRSTIHVLHVTQGKEFTPVQKKNEDDLNELLININDAYYRYNKDNLLSVIQEFQEDNDIQLLVMVNKKKAFLESIITKPIIHKLGHQLSVPLLVLPAN